MGRDFCNETELRAVVSLFQLKKDLDIKQLYTYLCPIIIFVCFFSIIFNAILMSISRQSKAVNKSPILLLSLNLALTDLIASLFNGLGILFNSYLPEVFDRKMPPCAMLTFEVIRCAALIASALHLLALAFVHYRGIVNPLHYRSTIFFSQHLSRSVNIISVCCWIIPLTIMIVWFSSTPCQGFQTAQCDYLFLTQFNFRYMMLTVFSVPLLLMSAIYIRIFLIINRHQQGQRLQHEQSALVYGVLTATGAVASASGAAASVNLPELMIGAGGGAGGGGSDSSREADRQRVAADRCPVCSGHKPAAGETTGDYCTSEENDEDDGEDEEEGEEGEEEGGDDDDSNNDQEEEDCDRTRAIDQHEQQQQRQSGISVLPPGEELGSASEPETAAGTRTGERALLICTELPSQAQHARANKSKTPQDGSGGVTSTRPPSAATDGGPGSLLLTLDGHIPLADDRSATSAAAAAARTKETSGAGQQGPPSGSHWEAGGDSLRDELGPSAALGGECDMNLNKKQQARSGQSLDGSQMRRAQRRRLQREKRKARLGCSSSLRDGGLQSSQSSSQTSADQNNNSGSPGEELHGGAGQKCTCDNKLKPATSQRAVKLARANTIGFATNELPTAAADEQVATMGTSLRILRRSNGQPVKAATVVTVAAAGDAGSSISCTSYSGAAAADAKARIRPSPLRLQLRRSPTTPAQSAAAASGGGRESAHSSVRASSSSYTPSRLRTKIDAAASSPGSGGVDATSVSATTMTSGIPAGRPFGSGKNNSFGAWLSGDRMSANSSVHHHHVKRHHEPQRRHVHASATPQTNTKALVTTLLILGTYVVSYVPAIAWHALTCIDSVVCPFPLYGIPYGWRVLFGSMTTLLLIAKSIVDPLIYSYRMNEIQVALSRYLSKRRSKSSSHATSLHTSQRFTFNAGGGGGGTENPTYQTNAGGNPSTANSSFKILTNHNSSRHNKHNFGGSRSNRPSPLATATATPPTATGTKTTIGEITNGHHQRQASKMTNGGAQTPAGCALVAAKPLIVTSCDHQNQAGTAANVIELVRVAGQTTSVGANDLTSALTRQAAATGCNGLQREAAASHTANVRVKSLKFDEESAVANNRNSNNIPIEPKGRAVANLLENSNATNSIVVGLQQPKQQQQQQRLSSIRHNSSQENNTTASGRGDLVC